MTHFIRFEDFTSNNSGIVGNREEDPASLAAPTKVVKLQETNIN